MSLRGAYCLPSLVNSSKPLLFPRHSRLYGTILPASSIHAHISQDGASYHWDTPAPTPAQLQRAMKFYKSSPPTLLFSSTTFRNVHTSSLPEVAFFGRSNVGKSSLLNALMGQDICHTSSKPGRTRSMNFFAVGGEDGQGNKGRLAVLDMPGYGQGSHAEWGREIEKYLKGRKQLKRAFLLIDALHGLKPTDQEVLALFRKLGVPHQVILSKVDRVLFPKLNNVSAGKFRVKLEQNGPVLAEIVESLRKKLQPGLGDGPEALGEVITCSTHKLFVRKKFGVDEVRRATLTATGLDEQKKWTVNSTVQSPVDQDQPAKIISEEDLVIREPV